MNTTWGHKTVQDVRVQDRDGVLAKAKGQTTDSAQCSSLESLGQGSAQKISRELGIVSGRLERRSGRG